MSKTRNEINWSKKEMMVLDHNCFKEISELMKLFPDTTSEDIEDQRERLLLGDLYGPTKKFEDKGGLEKFGL